MDKIEAIREIFEYDRRTKRLNIFSELGIVCHLGMALLERISERDGEINVGELALDMNASKPNVSRALKNLEQDGMIVRRTAPNDRRNILLKLTEAGRAFYKENTEKLFSFVYAAFCRLSDEDLSKCIDITKKIHAAYCEELKAHKDAASHAYNNSELKEV